MPRLPSYVPNVYQPNSNLAEMIMRRGEQQANAQRDFYGGLGNTVAGLGQGAADLIGQRQEQKAQQAKQAEMSKRDAAWVSYVESGEWQKDPAEAYKVTTRIWGATKEAEEHFKGLQGAAQLIQPKRDAAADAKSLGAIIGAIDATPEGPGRARLYQAAVPLAKAAFPELQVEDQYNPETWGEKSALGKQLRGEKQAEAAAPKVVGKSLVSPEGKLIYRDPDAPKEPKEPKMYTVTVKGPDGLPVEQIVSEAEMRKGVPKYVAPEKAAPPGKLTKDERQQFASIDFVLPKVDAFEKYVTDNAGKFGKWDSVVQGLKQQVPGLADGDYASKRAFVGRMNAEIRHALFGASLTAGEQESAKSFLIDAEDQPPVILAKIRDAKSRMQHDVDYYSEQGYKVGGAKPDSSGWHEVDGAKVRVKK